MNIIKMLFNLYSISSLSIIIVISVASASPVTEASQSSNDIIEYSTDLAFEENEFPLMLRSFGVLTEYAPLIVAGVINWLASNYSFVLTGAVTSFCRLSNLCAGVEHYMLVARHMAGIVTQLWTPENLQMAEKFVVPVIRNYLEGEKGLG